MAQVPIDTVTAGSAKPAPLDLANPKFFADVATLLADTATDYYAVAGPVPAFLAASPVVAEGGIVQTKTEGFIYRVAAANATDHNITTAGGIKLYVLPNSGNSIAVEAFGVVSGGTQTDSAFVAVNTARMQAAWNYSGATGVVLTFMAESASSPYFVTHLNLLGGLRLSGGPRSTYIQLPTTNWTGTDATAPQQYFIRRPDDNVRYLGGEIRNITFCTATSSVSNAQDTNRNLAGIAHAGLESWNWENVNFFGFGQGGVIMARAEAGAEGMGFSATTQDGNYNTFKRITCNSCGRYRADAQSRAGVVLLFKANSNNFFGIFSRGNTDSSSVACVYGTNNVFVHGTGESCEYAVRSGRNAAYNVFQGFRGEGVTATHKCYEWEGASDANGPLAFNWIIGPHLSTGTTDVEFDDGHNCWVQGAGGRDPLRARRKRGVSALTRADGLIDVRGVRVRPDAPFEIFCTLDDGRTYNDATCIPYMEIINGILGTVSGQKLGSVDFINSDTSTGAAGTSASVEARFEGSAGQTAIVLSTGTGTTLTERMRVKSNGIVDIPVLESADATFIDADVERLIISTSVTLPNQVSVGSIDLDAIQLNPSGPPSNPAEGAAKLWLSDGTLGAAGSLMIKVRQSNVTEYGAVFAIAGAVALPGYIFDTLRADIALVSRLNGDADTNGMPDANDTEGTYNGSFQGAVAYGNLPDQVETTGRSFLMDGTSSHITQVEAAQPASPFTFSAWVYFDTLSAVNQRVVSVSLDANTGWELYLPTSGTQLELQVFGDAIYSTAHNAVRAGEWIHVAVVGSGASTGIYVNGVLSGGLHSATFTLGGPVRWGRARTAAGYLDGRLADLMIYSRALTGAEILAIAEGP